jgi:hypothetical protein
LLSAPARTLLAWRSLRLRICTRPLCK